ncbi:MAG: signal peptidase II, partial [Spirochaetaceae bacterium]|nr:signal peptidase II [Spirochaetaceae bacterium]
GCRQETDAGNRHRDRVHRYSDRALRDPGLDLAERMMQNEDKTVIGEGLAEKPQLKKILTPFILSAVIVILDQVAKALVVRLIPDNTIAVSLMNDFLWIVNTRNLGIAFSIGDTLSQVVRIGLFIVVPLVFLVIAVMYCFRTKTITGFQRWAIAIIVGGGLGNLIDRIFRPEGVIDFISFSMFGLFGYDRFPTFNIADLSVTVGAIMLILSGFFSEKKSDRKEEEKGNVEKN